MNKLYMWLRARKQKMSYLDKNKKEICLKEAELTQNCIHLFKRLSKIKKRSIKIDSKSLRDTQNTSNKPTTNTSQSKKEKESNKNSNPTS